MPEQVQPEWFSEATFPRRRVIRDEHGRRWIACYGTAPPHMLPEEAARTYGAATWWFVPCVNERERTTPNPEPLTTPMPLSSLTRQLNHVTDAAYADLVRAAIRPVQPRQQQAPRMVEFQSTPVRGIVLMLDPAQRERRFSDAMLLHVHSIAEAASGQASGLVVREDQRAVGGVLAVSTDTGGIYLHSRYITIPEGILRVRLDSEHAIQRERDGNPLDIYRPSAVARSRFDAALRRVASAISRGDPGIGRRTIREDDVARLIGSRRIADLLCGRTVGRPDVVARAVSEHVPITLLAYLLSHTVADPELTVRRWLQDAFRGLAAPPLSALFWLQPFAGRPTQLDELPIPQGE